MPAQKKNSSAFLGPVALLILVSLIFLFFDFDRVFPQSWDFGRTSGGGATLLLALLAILSAFKLLFTELAKKGHLLNVGLKLFAWLHTYLGWFALILAAYHSIYYIYDYFVPASTSTTTLMQVLTGLFALISLVVLIATGKEILPKYRSQKSSSKKHVIVFIVFVISAILHLMFV